MNNASTLGPSPLPALAGYPLADLEIVYRVNALAPLGLIQLTLPLLAAAHGTVVNISSDAAVEPTRAGAATARPRPPSTS